MFSHFMTHVNTSLAEYGVLYCISHQSAVEVPYILIRELPSTVTDGFRSVCLRGVVLIAMFDLRLNFPLNKDFPILFPTF